jgi:hypothetical protein
MRKAKAVNTQERMDGLVKALTSEDMLGSVIRIHLYIEFELNTFIQGRLPAGAFEALRLEYFKKIDLAIALGLPADLKSLLRKVGEIRNNFAHNLDYRLQEAEVDALFKSFGPKLKDVLQRSFARARRSPLGAGYPSTLQEMNPASRLQFYTMQIWTVMAHFNDLSFFPE